MSESSYSLRQVWGAGPGAVGSSLHLSRYFLLAAWCVACMAPLRWMGFALAQPTHAVQRGVLLGLAVLGLYDFVTRARAPHSHPQALPIVLLGIAVAALTRLSTDLQFVHAGGALFLLYALSASFMDAQAWRRRCVLLVLVLLCLPIQPHVDAHLGLPLRLWTAHAVAPLLRMLGVGNVTVESIIVTENGVADVANACSGVRTLWYAVALGLGARLAWPQAPARHWWLAGLLGIVVAVGFNALRVTVLVLALHHHAPPLLADMAHASLGLLALAVVGAIQVFLCRTPEAAPARHPSGGALPWQVHTLLAGLMLALALIPPPSHHASSPARLRALAWPTALHTEPVPLSASERELVLGRGATVAEKQRFTHQGVRGSLLVVESSNWRAHHAPELCLLAQGAHLEHLSRVTTPDGAFRVMVMQAGSQTAITWFQSDARVLPDLGARWWSQLLRPKEHWSLITVVVDGPVSAPAALALHQAVHAVVAHSHRKTP